MKILGLPGIKPVTAQWMDQLLAALNLNQKEAITQHYQCWTHGNLKLDIDKESNVAAKSNPDIVIAKSIGTRILINAISNNLIPVKPFVFIGIPIKSYSENEISELKNLCAQGSTLIIQQDNDPAGSFSTLESSIANSPICKMIEVPGNDHIYGNIDELKLIIESWFKKN